MNFLTFDNVILQYAISSLLAAAVIVISLVLYRKINKAVLKNNNDNKECLKYIFYMNFVKLLFIFANIVLVLYFWGIDFLGSLSTYLHSLHLSIFEDLVSLAIRLICSILIILLSKLFSSFIIKTLTKENRSNLNPLASLFLSKILNTGLALFWIFIFLYIWGFDLTHVVTGLGVTGVVVAFAMKESLSSVFSGFMIALKSPFQLGDVITVGALTGKVVSIDLTSVTIDTYDSIRIVLTNQQVWAGQIINYSHFPTRLLEIRVPLHYSTNIDEFRTLVLNELKNYKEIHTTPEPRVYIPNFEDVRVNAVIAFTVDNADYFRFRDLITERVVAIMNANNIKFVAGAIDINKQN